MYLTTLGMFAFFAGRFIPKDRINPNAFPYKSCQFERKGKLYEQLGVRKWQNKVFDMSKLFPKFIPKKKLQGHVVSAMPLMIKETCVAELVHWLLIIPGFYCLVLWEGVGGVAIVCLYELGNIPYIIIQRYNRPRFIAMQNRLEKHNVKTKLPENEAVMQRKVS